MRFMVMHKVDARMEAGGPPDQQIIQSMGALVQESLRSGVFITGAGLQRSAKRTRLARVGGEEKLVNGPYTGKNELLASFAMVRGKSMDEAVGQARRLARASGDAEVEVGPVVEPWDLGIAAKPAAELPSRFLLLVKGDAEFESGAAVPEARRAELTKVKQSFQEEQALLVNGKLAPSSKGARLASNAAGKRSWVDGPFAESKELIAGFSILELPSLRDAIVWADRYVAVLGENEVDVRELLDD